MWCTRWFLPLLLLPLPTAPPFFLLLFLFSLTLHAKPCFYCIVLLATLFVTSCYWQPFPLDSPLSIPWSENITTFSEALIASLPTNYSQPLPTVIRAVDRCWCDLSAGSFFEPFNVSRWEHISVARLENELERLNRAAPEPNTTESAVNATQSPVESSVTNPSSQHTWSLFTNWLLHRRKVAVVEESETPPVKEAESWLRKEYDLRPQGFDVVLDFSWRENALRSEAAFNLCLGSVGSCPFPMGSLPSHHRPSCEGNVDTSQNQTRFDFLQRAIMAPFNHTSSDSTRILSDLAPVIMTPRMMNSSVAISSRHRTGNDRGTLPTVPRNRVDFATIGRAPLRLTLGSHQVTSHDLQIMEATEELLEAEVPELQGVVGSVSLLRGFNATIPSSDKNRARRRQMRKVDTPRLGLKRLGVSARGLMTDDDGHSVTSEDDVVVVSRSEAQRKGKRRARESLSAAKTLGKEELNRQTEEILRDKENLHVRRGLINNEIEEITHKIEALDSIRVKLEEDLLKLQEDELELTVELEGVKERLAFEQSSSRDQKSGLPASSRRKKGPSFLPSEHDELPPGVAFITLESHTTPITALDFSEPYGTLVSASQEDAQPRVWDLLTGSEIGRLRGHNGTVKCLQVESHLCLTGGEDGTVRLWDLRKVDDDGTWGDDLVSLSDVVEEEGASNAGSDGTTGKDDTCLRLLEGHTKAVTALYFEDDCLVTGASDKTLRQWDLNTGQCVMTMDILWAISHSHPTHIGSSVLNPFFPPASTFDGQFSVPMPANPDGSWDMFEDFVGGVQFWGYGLVSGSGDGAVRMWDMRTGQAHRTLLGHTGPITCVQFDEIHIMSGSLDKTIRVWDLRAGGTFHTLEYDHAVTALQFDTRKIVAAVGENDVKVYNRTSMQHSKLVTNGHTKPIERLRYIDRYLVSGGRDSMLKIWSL